MKSFLKIAVPLVILVAVIFGITLFSQYTTRDPGAEKPSSGDPPLRFTSSTRAWIPGWFRRKLDEERMKGSEEANYRIQDAFFPGFFEPNSDGTAAFWFENTNESGVTLKLEKISCKSCSKGAIYIVPPETAKLTLQMSGLTLMPQGLLSALPVGMIGPGALFDRKHLPPAEAFPFADPSKVVFNVPGANNPDNWTPCWGILELGFNAGVAGDGRHLEAHFTSSVNDNPGQVGSDKFEIKFDVVEPIQVFPPAIDYGVLDESTKPDPREFIVYSSTREPGAFPVPTILPRAVLGGDSGKFLTVGTPIAIPASDFDFIALNISERLKKPVRVTAAYRVPVNLNLKLGNERLDIGQLERNIDVSVLGIDSPTKAENVKAVNVKAVVRGGVWLPEGNAYDLGSFKASAGVTNSNFELITDRSDIKVKVADGQQQPEFVQVTIEEQKPLGSKGHYKVRVHIPPSKQVGLINNGVIVFEILGPNPQRVRIPLKGRGDL